ncbi:hypothetical protein FB446DRAFT_425782 [Lentinula raphanica]|nr:hypothetical protein FB446DRAFT_425782 [Lentinula raphanica]
MANSAQHVTHALQDAKRIVLDQRAPYIPKSILSKANEDVHLQALQMVAAHIKLLLDVPEYLWRMLERKNFFSAAWLYLLSRVVQRALIREELDEEVRNLGIDVSDSFPIIQRQWEVVAQFRSQIVHRAVIALRDFNATSQATCATLLSLHLLDSRPLSDTLSALLDQRSKSLSTLLSKPPTPPGSIRDINQCILSTLQLISQTMKAARDVFHNRNSCLSLMRTTLEFIQTDVIPSTGLPSELQLTTQSLLSGLPSSSVFSTLPQNLTSYKPHVDVNSQFSSLAPAYLDEKLSTWFQSSSNAIRRSYQTWVSDIDSVKVMWFIRNSVRTWLHTSASLESSENSQLMGLADEVCRQHIVEIWQRRLFNAETAFRDKLTATVTSLAEGSELSLVDPSPLAHLFDAAPLPSVSQMEEKPLQRYRASLQCQLSGRTPLLNDVLKALENCASTVHEDLYEVLHGNDPDTATLIMQLRESCKPHAQQLCTGSLEVMASLSSALPDDTVLNINALMFIGRVSEELSTSPFISDISCHDTVALAFRHQSQTLFDSIIERWQRFTVTRLLSQHRVPVPVAGSKTSNCGSPSTELMQSLFLLAEAVQNIGFSKHSKRHARLAEQTVHLFISRLLDREWEYDKIQALNDIGFLSRIAELWGLHWNDVRQCLDAKRSQIRDSIGVSDDMPLDENISRISKDYLTRTQTIIAAILPYRVATSASSKNSEKLASLLPLGVPSPDAEYYPVFEVVKPSSRFALLLVD